MENHTSVHCCRSVRVLHLILSNENIGFTLFRMEDLTEPELIRTNPLTNRTICLYGYVRGCPLKADTPIHIPGEFSF